MHKCDSCTPKNHSRMSVRCTPIRSGVLSHRYSREKPTVCFVHQPLVHSGRTTAGAVALRIQARLEMVVVMVNPQDVSESPSIPERNRVFSLYLNNFVSFTVREPAAAH